MSSERSTSPLLTPEQLNADLDGNDEIVVLDCRFSLMQPAAGRESYLASHIPGARYVHLDDDLAAPVTPNSGRHPLPDANRLANTFGSLGIGDDTEVVVYDDAGGAMAARAWWLLHWLGHESVSLLDGGFPAWVKCGFETVAGREPPPVKQTLRVRLQNDWVVSTEELHALIRSATSPVLLDARDTARFRGDEEPIDTVAGHVPGARNLPFTDALAEDGRFRRGDALQALWEGIPDDDGRWIVMCGSGVTACHLAISALTAGRPMPLLYAGSWSEWIRDPARPVALGEG